MKKGIRLVSSAIILGYLLFAPMALAQSDKEQVRFSWQNFAALKNYVDVPVKYTTEFSLQQANILSQAIHFFTPKKKAQVTSAATPTPTPVPNLPIPPPLPSLPPVPQKQISSTPIIVQLPTPVATPSSNSVVVNSGKFLNRTEVVAEIQRALTKALGTAPYTDGTSFPYYPVYKQIAEQGHHSIVAAQDFATVVVTNSNSNSTSNSSSVDLTGSATTLTGALGVTNGGTGLSSAPTYGKVLLGNSSGGYDLVSTTSLGISSSFSGTTDNITEGSINKFYNDTFVNSYIHASSTIPKTYTSNTFSNSNIFSGAVTIQTLNGPLQANNGVVSATTSVGVGYGGTGASSFGQGWIFSSGGTTALSASTSPTINYLVATSTRASILPYASSTALTANTLFSTNATTTSFNTSSLGIGPEYITDLTGSGLSISGSALTCSTASGSVFGCLSTSDWSTFNSKANIDWDKESNYGVFTLTPTTTIPVWIKDQLFASSSLVVAGRATANNFIATGTISSTLPYASSTALTATALFSTNFTTTNATTTAFYASGIASIGSTTPWATLAVNPVAGAAANQFVVGSSTATNFIIKNTGSVGVGTSTPGSLFAVNGTNLAQNFVAYGTGASVLPYASSTAFTATSLYGTNFLVTGSTTLQNFAGLNATTTNATSTNLFATNQSFTNLFGTNATTSALYVSGTLSIGSTTPSSSLSVNGSAWLDLATLNLSSTTAAGLTVNYNASTTNIIGSNRQGAWSIASSTSSSGNPVFNISMSSAGATSTVGFFVSTSTGLIAGVGNPVPSALKNYVIVGNGNVQAGMAIVKGGLCVDSDGWCTASTTGVISTSGGVQTANSDLAEIYYSDEALEPGDVVTSSNPASFVKKADTTTAAPIGVVSTKPGLVLGLGPDQQNTNGYPIALAGRVPIKVSGKIDTGDFLTISDAPGVAEKVSGDSQVIAQALESFEGNGVGKIMAIVKSSFYKAPNTEVAFLKTFASTTDARITSLENQIKDIKGLTINSIGSEGVPVSILSDANFFGRPYFTNDTVGSALIKKGARTVAVTFDRDYTDAPEVQATLALNEAAASTGADEAVFSQDVRFVVTQRNVHGFVIKINKPAPADITFSWLALAAKNTKLFSSIDQPIEAIIASPSPSPSPSPAIIEPAPVPSVQETTATSTEEATTTPPVEPAIETAPAPTPEITPEPTPQTPADSPEPTPAPEPATSEPVTETTTQ